MKRKTALPKILIIGIFAIAFAFVEASVVVYLRKLFGFGEEYFSSAPKVLLNLGFIAFLSPETSIFPDKFISQTELLREVSTIIILITIALLSAKNLKKKLGAFLIAFSIWDLFYYLFLRLLIGWPKGLLDLDIFFLIPVPWVGPVITPLVFFTLLLILGVFLYSKY